MYRCSSQCCTLGAVFYCTALLGAVLESVEHLKKWIKKISGSVSFDSFLWFRLTFCTSSSSSFPPLVLLWRPASLYSQILDVLLLDHRETGRNKTLLINEDVSQLGPPSLTGLLASPGGHYWTLIHVTNVSQWFHPWTCSSQLLITGWGRRRTTKAAFD